MFYFLVLIFFLGTCYEILHKKSLILCFLDEFQKGFNLDAILYVNVFFVAENYYYYYY